MRDDKNFDLIRNKELLACFYYLRKHLSRNFKKDQMTELNGKTLKIRFPFSKEGSIRN